MSTIEAPKRLSAADRLRSAMRLQTAAAPNAPEQKDDSQPAAGQESSVPTAEPPSASSEGTTVAEVIEQEPSRGELAAVASPADPAKAKTASERMRERTSAASAAESNGKEVRKEMAAMKALTRLLEAVFNRPGSGASEAERMAALTTLSQQAHELGDLVARRAGEDPERSTYIKAMGMEAAVGLVCKGWEQGINVNWGNLIDSALSTPEIDSAADAMAQAVYNPVATVDDAADRLALSMHAAYWQVYSLGETVNGISARLAAEVVRDCSNYLQGRNKFVASNDLYVSWLQGSIRRLTDLVCAETRARFTNVEAGPSPEDIQDILNVARSGFEGVENYAQSILEKPSSSPVPRPTDR